MSATPSVPEIPSDLAEAAEWYAFAGARVFPCNPAGSGPDAKGSLLDKQPLGRLAPHGCLNASNDEAKIKRWWSETPNANIGLATGSASGVWALDVDPRHGGDVALAAMIATHGSCPRR